MQEQMVVVGLVVIWEVTACPAAEWLVTWNVLLRALSLADYSLFPCLLADVLGRKDSSALLLMPVGWSLYERADTDRIGMPSSLFFSACLPRNMGESQM